MAGGSAGDQFLQGLFTGEAADLQNTEQVDAFADKAKDIRAAAESGGWAVNEDLGAALLKAVDKAEMTFADLGRRAHFLAQAPKLGEDGYARTVAEHVRNAMDSDEQSLLPNLQTFQQVLADVREAIAIAKSKYDESDAAAGKQLSEFEQ